MRLILQPGQWAALGALCVLSGCAGGGTNTPRHLPSVPPPHRVVPPPPHVLAAPGLGGVIGARAEMLGRMFGPPRLDGAEGDARKMQFVGTACVLDVWLYPPHEGEEPQAT